MVTVKRIAGGVFSNWVGDQLKAGDDIHVMTPHGSFTTDFDPARTGRYVAFAGGSGITPIMSLIRTALKTEPKSRFTLFYGNRSSDSVMFAEEVADLKNRYGARFDVVHVLSREPRDVELFSGRLDADRIRSLVAAFVPIEAVDHVWLCGPHAMIDSARGVLADLGVAPDRVHFELFYVDEPPPAPDRPDAVPTGETASVTVVLDGRTTTAAVSKDEPILDSAQHTRADLPFACKGGVCGTCRAHLVAGEVDMRRNYALEEDEVARGFVLTCQSYPTSDEVTVDFDAS